MYNFFPGDGFLSPVPQQTFAPGTYAAMQSQTAANNALSANYESQQRLKKNYNNFVNDSNIDALRGQLSTLTISPLRRFLEITTAIPFETFPLKGQRFVKNAASALGVSVEMVAVCLMGAVFIAARGSFKLEIDENWSEILTGMFLIAAPSGERKSAVVDLMRPVFKAFETELQTNSSRCGRQNDRLVLQQALKKMERKLAKCVQEKIQLEGCSVEQAKSDLQAEFAAIDQMRESIIKPTVVPRILLDSPTLEALAVELEKQNEAIGIFEAEGGFWKSRLRPSVDDILLKGFTGESFSSDTKTRGNVYLQSPVLAACSLVQPEVLHAVYDNDELIGHGATARILPVLLASQKGNQRSFLLDTSNDLIDWYEELIRRLLKIRRPVLETCEGKRTIHILTLNSEAKTRVRRYGSDVDERIRNGYFENFPAFGAKLAGHAVRLAGAIHLMTHEEPQSQEIDERSMDAGIAWAEFFRAHAEAAFTPEVRQGIVYAQKIYKWMRHHRPQIFEERDAQRGIGRCSIIQIRAGIDELAQRNLVRTYITGKKALCLVHPSAYSFSI